MIPCTTHRLGSFSGTHKTFSCGRCGVQLTPEQVRDIEFRMRAARTAIAADVQQEAARLTAQAREREAQKEAAWLEWLKLQPAPVQAAEKARVAAEKARIVAEAAKAAEKTAKPVA